MPKAPTGRGGASGKRKPATTGGLKKQRWSSDKRQARGLAAERPRGGKTGRPDRSERSERPNWEPRNRDEADAAVRDAQAASDVRAGRPPRRTAPRASSAGDFRPGRSISGGGDKERRRPAPRHGDRPDRTDRPVLRDRADRPERREHYERTERPQRTPFERPDRDRTDRAPSERTDRDRAERAPRDRTERAPRDRTDRDRTDRDRTDRDRTDRAPRERTDRERAERAPRDRTERAPRERYDRADREPREPRPAPAADVVLERLEAAAVQSADTDGVTFADLGLGQNIVRELAELGAAEPFPIQAATIPDALAGRDVLGRGRTGSGKTIAFAAPLVERILRSRADRSSGERRKPGRAPSALILAPTRELALQIDRTVQPIARSVGLFTTQVYGGVPYARQYGALSRGVDIVIGTPGRVEDLVEQGRLDLSEVAITVLDEADHMTDLGFLEPVQRILRRTADDGQRMLFSASLDTAVAALVDEFLADPAVHEVAGDEVAAPTIEHLVFTLDQRDKLEVLAELAAGPAPKLVFVRTRSFAEDVADLLDDRGIDAVALHGDLTQPRRTRNLERFSRGRATVLVATDVAARGIHIDDVALIVQADAPDEYKTYLHRSGRTGRAGKEGVVVTLVAKNRRRRVEELLARADIQAEWTAVRPGDATVDRLVEQVNTQGDEG